MAIKRATSTSTRAACQWAQFSPHLNFARKQDFLLILDRAKVLDKATNFTIILKINHADNN